MKGMKKKNMRIKSNILSAELNEFTDRETGVVTKMTKINYTVECEESERICGVAVLEAYKPGNFLKEIELYTKAINMNGRYVRPLVDLEIEKQYTKNGEKYVLRKINEFDFSKKKEKE